MISDHIDHYPDSHGVSLVDKCLERGLITEVRINLLPIAGPISVISFIEVVNNGGDPDGIKAEILHVLELLSDTIEITTAVVVQIAEIGVAVAAPETISQDLVNCALLPAINVPCSRG